MSQRERQAAAGASAATLTPPEPPSARPVRPPESAPLAWEDYFPVLPASQQEALLDLAARQGGLLRASQLPPAAPAATDRARPFLNRLFAGQPLPLLALPTEPPPPLDAALDAAQREAVLRGLETPDLCLIQGPPGSGKSCVIAELVRQAARAGQRVLLLAPSAAAVDRVLEGLAGTPEALIYRCLGRDERAEALPAVTGRCTWAGRARHLREELLPRARAAADRAERRLADWESDEPRRAALVGLAERWVRVEGDLEQLRARFAPLAEEVEREAEAPSDGPFAAALRDAGRASEEEQTRVTAAEDQVRSAVAEQRRSLEEQTGRLRALRPLAEAKQSKRWWTNSWWKATFSGNVLVQTQELDASLQQAAEKLAKLEAQEADLAERRRKAEAEARAARARCVAAEIERRRRELEAREAELRREQDVLTVDWQKACQALSPESPRPSAPAPEAVREAEALGRQLHEQARPDAEAARRWVAALEALAEDWPARLLPAVNCVAGTLAALAGDEHFGEPSVARQHFDLLVLDEAHIVSETDFLRVARRAKRWVLVGEPADERPPSREQSANGPRGRGGRPVPARATPSQPAFFPRLWEHLHCDAWSFEGDRLRYRLRPLAAEQRGWLESESMADFPDVELRILTPPQGTPALAEVLFPPSMSVFDAKAYIFRELDQLSTPAGVGGPEWVGEPGRLLLRWGGAVPATARPLELAPGVREWVAERPSATGPEGVRPVPWWTAAIEFAPAAGWDRAKAEAWVRDHLSAPDPGRVVRLVVPHRPSALLAPFVAELLSGVCAPAAGPAGAGEDAAVFVPVPALPDPGPTRNGHAPVRRIPAGLKGGAGLEIDLSDARQRERLPAELRDGLPDRGFVNLAEAQAVVRWLESGRPASAGDGKAVPVAVLALYPAQAELIRRLLRRVPALAALAETVDVPGGMRQREADTVVVSLTRSHSHRAVPFGDGPATVALALTRARARLVLVGDPGTLARRAQWDGPLDHLDEAASARERQWVAALLRNLQGNLPRTPGFRLHEGFRP